ncbi:fatty acyl-CoA reductase 1-like [Hordeum vulgare subsp. vulgare]|nr:fatty acyl-CoA reductase 1-like [Hordeum vulgare subsp. vulgare]
MVGTLNEQKITQYFKNKNILITGSTGLLGKVLLEKILRVQPDVKKIYLPVRAVDSVAAKERVDTEVVGNELFGILREKHGDMFQSFTVEKIVPFAGDVMYEDFGIDVVTLRELQLTEDLEIIINAAATTNFCERYDVALGVNVVGVKHMCNFAKKCPNLDVLLHISTAYVAGEKQGLVQERLFKDGETLRAGTHLNIDIELSIAKDLKKKLETDVDMSSKAMKELGLSRARHFGWPNTYVFTKTMGEMILSQLLRREDDIPVVIVRPSIITSILNDPLPGWIQGTRTIDKFLISYAKQNLPCALGDLDLTMDVIPSNMVVNAIISAIVTHSSLSNPKREGAEDSPVVYHVSSSTRHPVPYGILYRTAKRYFNEHPRVGTDGRVVPTREVWLINNITLFHFLVVVTFRFPLELLHVLSILCCGLFGLGPLYHDLAEKYRILIKLMDIYGPFALFKGCFDDFNLNKLRLSMIDDDASIFNFDPKTIDWEDYFYRVHIPGVMKYLFK